MSETTTRSRKCVALIETDGSAIHLALAILRIVGITDTVMLNSHLDGGQFDTAGESASGQGIETINAYPDRIALLDDGSVLICDGIEGAAIGSLYEDEVRTSDHLAAAEPSPIDSAALAEARTAGMPDDETIEMHSPGIGEPGYGEPLAIQQTPEMRLPPAAGVQRQLADEQRVRDAALFDGQAADEPDPVDVDHPSNLTR